VSDVLSWPIMWIILSNFGPQAESSPTPKFPIRFTPLGVIARAKKNCRHSAQKYVVSSFVHRVQKCQCCYVELCRHLLSHRWFGIQMTWQLLYCVCNARSCRWSVKLIKNGLVLSKHRSFGFVCLRRDHWCARTCPSYSTERRRIPSSDIPVRTYFFKRILHLYICNLSILFQFIYKILRQCSIHRAPICCINFRQTIYHNVRDIGPIVKLTSKAVEPGARACERSGTISHSTFTGLPLTAPFPFRLPLAPLTASYSVFRSAHISV